MSVITLHVLTSVPYSNLNRDDRGQPKAAIVGGVERALISSQAIKRGARRRYEEAILHAAGVSIEPDISGIVTEARESQRFIPGVSVRSGNLATLISERAAQITTDQGGTPDGQELKRAKALVSSLVKSEGDNNTDSEATTSSEKSTSSWLSSEEIEAAAAFVAAGGKDVNGTVADGGRTGSLAIASFGRMFAKLPEKNTHAAVSVGFSLTTHAANMNDDYFTTGDEAMPPESGSGAGFIDTNTYTSGVFYRTVTFDRAQLHRNWTGITGADAAHSLGLMVRALIDAAPSGKQTTTSPFTPPLVVLAEEQRYRFAYDFETPVQGADAGGYAAASIRALSGERDALRRFDPDAVSDAVVAGVADTGLLGRLGAGDPVPVTELVSFVVDRLL